MVFLDLVKSSNTKLPSHLVAVFVGGTSGIGEYALKAFAKHCKHPRAYFIGRSQKAADRISSELKTLNPDGEYIFMRMDTGLLKNVDKACQELKAKEKVINILFITTGTLSSGTDTEEGLHLAASLIVHSRTRFMLNLLPLLRAAPDLRRVVSVMAGTKEGPFVNEDFQCRNVPLMRARGQGASTITLSLETVAKMAPEVSFIHDFPGPVRSNIARDPGFVPFILKAIFKVFGPLVYIPNDESGERHLYLATSAQYPPHDGEASGVPVGGGLAIAHGTNGKPGSGVYTVDQHCESGGAKNEELLAKLRTEGWDKKIWDHIQGEFVRITGKESI
ncbi:uncharacterized protein BDR25DRAFT_300590 [Lindgomyces ingoldianus]|uniref:Uncharacterized protein n=1 Tax=Lindgomyces ingoldianus TaxID=673940 RepID=A0ACB6RBN7_9PLEO|nr:uncharacterized protein BDR25DRAFT_300590 [Lindgomyces ingoldianus]KAF2476698.1 hypothetical protein BDR25DRAFT_300590 [Lindgomyces ingoldianus]